MRKLGSSAFVFAARLGLCRVAGAGPDFEPAAGQRADGRAAGRFGPCRPEEWRHEGQKMAKPAKAKKSGDMKTAMAKTKDDLHGLCLGLAGTRRTAKPAPRSRR